MIRTAPIALAALALLTATVGTASAHDRYNAERAYAEIQAERERQRALIERGREDGSITWYEKYTLNRSLTRIDELERAALADGRLSRDEARLIREAQADAARHIRAERHDEQVRGWWWRLWRSGT